MMSTDGHMVGGGIGDRSNPAPQTSILWHRHCPTDWTVPLPTSAQPSDAPPATDLSCQSNYNHNSMFFSIRQIWFQGMHTSETNN